jgi:hypothetical protein
MGRKKLKLWECCGGYGGYGELPHSTGEAVIKNGVDYAGTSDDKQRHGDYLQSA